jgi:hypothetical protein
MLKKIVLVIIILLFALKAEALILVDSFTVEPNGGQPVLVSPNVAKWGQAFHGLTGKIDSAQFKVAKFGSPTGNTYVQLYTIGSGSYGTTAKPGTLLATSDTLDISTFPSYSTVTDLVYKSFTFSGVNRISLATGTDYIIAVCYDGGDGSNYLSAGYNNATPTHDGNPSYFASSWIVAASWDTEFYVYNAEEPPAKVRGSTRIKGKIQ